MSTTERSAKSTTHEGSAPPADMRLEVVVIPVADPDRSKEYYTRLGWRLDADFAFDNHFRVVQFTPPGSALLDAVRLEDHDRASGLGSRPLPGRLRHRGRARRARGSRRRGQRGLPSGGAGCTVR